MYDIFRKLLFYRQQLMNAVLISLTKRSHCSTHKSAKIHHTGDVFFVVRDLLTPK